MQENDQAVLTSVETIGAVVAGCTTYRIKLHLQDSALNCYNIFGDAAPLLFPPAYQVSAPFGTNVGGVPPAFFAAMPDAQYDSWLTIGETSGDVGNHLGYIGIDFSAWTDASPLESAADTGGAVFWMDPDAATQGVNPDRTMVVAQLTLHDATSRVTSQVARFNAQGRSVGHIVGGGGETADWFESCIEVLVGGPQNGQGTHAVEVKHDACYGIDCGHHGTCADGTCICENGAYTGDRCQHFDPCHGIECGSHGRCVSGTSRGRCICESGAYTGNRCEHFDPCYGIDCGEHGSCSDGHCTCESIIYTGDRCQQFTQSCGNIQSNSLFTTFDCTGARYKIAEYPESILCANERCSARECCTTLRPTCGDIEADGSGVLFDCSVAQKYLNHKPIQAFCTSNGCSMVECCTADTPSAPTPPPSEANTGGSSCTTYPEFINYSQEVTVACCGPNRQCVAGLPTTCSEACADVLLSMQMTCNDFLGTIGMQDTVDLAAASCPTPVEPCTSYPEFVAYSQEVTAACCDDASAPCVAGLPTTCSNTCADVLLPMQRACSEFLATIGMQETVNAAVALCGSGH